MDELIKYIQTNNLGEYKENISFKKLTSLKIGGNAKLYVEPNSEESLKKIIQYLKQNCINYFIIGNGTNLLINDRYFDLVVINLKKLNEFISYKNGCFLIGAGCNAGTIASMLSKMGYTGFEFMSVIPGTIGGLTYMNASAFNRSMSDILVIVNYLDNLGNFNSMHINDFEFGYRQSPFQNKDSIITSVIINLTYVGINNISKEKIEKYQKLKANNQPINSKNAGSTFKNNNELPSWKIIDQLGYRGYSIGDAKVSCKHANFLINQGNATFDDMCKLINKIKASAINKCGINLECEWEIIE